MSLEFVSELPEPERSGRRSTLNPIVNELKQHPGEWAVVRRIVNDKLGRGRANTQCQTLRKKGLNTAVRSIDGQLVVFARYPQES